MRNVGVSMRRIRPEKIGISFALLFACACVAKAAPAPSLSADAVIQKAVEHSQHASAQNAQSAYTYTKVNVTEELDSTGKVKDRKEKVYQVSFRDGATRLKLLEVNGRAPS